MLANPLKLVIWDLDDTFWTGTLTEGGVAVPQKNIDTVIALSKRGIISSICSKNNFADARSVLEAHNVWSYFVFPRIEFAPKGAAIAALIEQMALRPDNVLFVDDNRLNLEEARHFSPALMVAHPDEILPALLDLPEAAGKDDSALTRLRQYKQLEQKADDFASSPLTNEEFLRQCDVRVKIDLDVEEHLDRVIELINRSNQLNFTKLRVETPLARDEFRRTLHAYGIRAGIIKVSDKYGDYGIVGFFMTQRKAAFYRLLHFVFSCRTMNMGIEQYVYESLGEPDCEIVPPVANGLKSFAKIDWIRTGDNTGNTASEISDAKLVLVGGCDLLQVATYCSSNRAEYVNMMRQGVMVRYDDLGFLLSPRDAVASSATLAALPCWNKEEALRFDADLNEARIVIVSLWDALNSHYLLLDSEIIVRRTRQYLSNLAAQTRDDSFLSRYAFIQLTPRQKVKLLARALARIVRLSPNAQARFLLGVNTRGDDRPIRATYNAAAAAYCARESSFEFVSIDEIVPEMELVDANHFTRKGYYAVAGKIIARIGEHSEATMAPGLHDVIKDAPVVTLSRGSVLSGYADTRAPRAVRLPRHRIRPRALQAGQPAALAAGLAAAVGRFPARSR